MKQRFLLIVLALMAMTTGVNAAAETLYVGNVKVDLSTTGTISGSGITMNSSEGRVYYAASVKELYLRDVTIKTGLSSSVEGLTIFIEDVADSDTDNCTIDYIIINSGTSATISGEGSLVVTSNGNNTGIYLLAGSQLTFSDAADVRISCGDYCIFGVNRTMGASVTVDNSLVTFETKSTGGIAIKQLGQLNVKGVSEVTIKGNSKDQAIEELGELNLENNISIYQPTGASFNSTSHTICASGSSTAYKGDIVLTWPMRIHVMYFPDDNFISYLKEQDYGKDDIITNRERYNVKEIKASGRKITHFNGIEYFPNLQKLNCSINSIGLLNVTKNTKLTQLDCHSNNLSELDISQNTALTELDCSKNTIRKLDLTSNTKLSKLVCDQTELTTLDVSKNTELQHLECNENKLTAIDVTNNTKLQLLYCTNNQLTELDLSKNTALGGLKCDNNQLTELDVSKNTNLRLIYCSNNKLTALNLQNNKRLQLLSCYLNSIHGANMDALIASLVENPNDYTYFLYGFCKNVDEGNVITKEQVAAAKKKGWTVYDENTREYEGSNPDDVLVNALYFPDKNFRHWVSGNADLNGDLILTKYELEAVKRIDLAGLFQIEGLSYGRVVSLKGIEFFTELTYLNCSAEYVENNNPFYEYNANVLTELDLSKNTKLDTLICTNNQLTTLDLRNNTALKYLNCYNNMLHELDLSNCKELEELECSYNQMQTLDVSKNAKLKMLFSYQMGLSTLNLQNPELKSIYCEYNELTTIDVSKCPALNYLHCDNNQLTSIDVSKNPKLKQLECSKNQLTTIDVSNNPDLKYFDCSHNQLKELDLSSNPELHALDCYNNQLEELDLSDCPEIERLYCFCNKIALMSMVRLISSLPVNWGELRVWFNSAAEGNSCSRIQVAAANKKGWKVYYNPTGEKEDVGWEWVYYEGGEQFAVAISAENFPDPNFRKAVADKAVDKNQDGCLSEEEMLALTEFYVNGKDIKDLTGIAYFTELQRLDCSANSLTTVDVSQNKKLTRIDIDRNNIKGVGMDKLIAGLPKKGGKLFAINFYKTDNEHNVITKSQVAKALERKWTVMAYEYDSFMEDVNAFPYQGSDDPEPGDVNGDNVTDVADIASIISVMATSVEGDLQYTTADVNKDGAVDVADIATVISIMATKARRMNTEE